MEEPNDTKDNFDFIFYPDTLKLKLRCKGQVNVNYLHVNMEITHGDLVTGVFDKRDGFIFETIKILYFNSNVHICIFRNIFLNGINRIERLSSTINDMI